jgi:hypothetical protein
LCGSTFYAEVRCYRVPSGNPLVLHVDDCFRLAVYQLETRESVARL